MEGTDLSQLLSREGRTGLPLKQVVHIVGEVAEALEFAHQHRLLHRDVKPANIMLAPSMHPEDPDSVMLADFGLAQIEGSGHSLTGTGNLVATLAYASPEQIEAKPFDHRVDIYALGCVLYELLTGEKPFPAENLSQVMQMHLKTPPPLPSIRRPDLPAAFDGIIMTALAKNPDRRYSSARELGRAIRTAAATAPSLPAHRQQDQTPIAGQPYLGEPTARVSPTLVAPGSGPLMADNNKTRIESVGKGSHRRLIPAFALTVVLLTGLILLVLQPFGDDESGKLPPTATEIDSASPLAKESTFAQITTLSSVAPSATQTSNDDQPTSADIGKTPEEVDPQGFSGEYQYRATLVDATGGGAQELIIGSTETAIWTVQTSCAQSPCISQIRTSEGGGYLGFTVSDDVWTETEDRKLSCKLIGSEDPTDSPALLVSERLSREMTVSEEAAGVVITMTGRTVRTQLEPCRNQFGELLTVTYEISLTKIK